MLTGDADADRRTLDAWAAKATDGLIEKHAGDAPAGHGSAADRRAGRADWEVPLRPALVPWADGRRRRALTRSAAGWTTWPWRGRPRAR
ncbi:hypothetical protein ACFYOV_13880 [Streptomyces sp. NPDC005931]|uniref:hypothetical protein n=1 Tax=Streptomyces sp. NPDC005931 TaxID=3364737 RepID=UPI0036BA51F4